MSWRRLEDVFWGRKAKVNIFVLIKTSWIRLQHVFRRRRQKTGIDMWYKGYRLQNIMLSSNHQFLHILQFLTFCPSWQGSQWTHLHRFAINSTSKFHVKSLSRFRPFWKNTHGNYGIDLTWKFWQGFNFQNRRNIDELFTWIFLFHFDIKSTNFCICCFQFIIGWHFLLWETIPS